MPEKTDLKKELKTLYAASARRAGVVEVPNLKYLMIEGAGHPEDNPAWQEAIGALYGVAYTVKFALKRETGNDFAVTPLESLWWVEGGKSLCEAPKEEWRWALLVPVPAFVDAGAARAAAKKVASEKTPAAARMRLKSWKEGRAIQMLHVGPYGEIGRTIEKMREAAAEAGLEFSGKRHEIYMSDPRRVAPERLKTIVRIPVKKLRL
jgi:hypothetical protein